MGVKSLTVLAGVEVANNSFTFGVQDDKPQIVGAGKVRSDTPEEREKALAEIVKKFKPTCWMFYHKAKAQAEV